MASKQLDTPMVHQGIPPKRGKGGKGGKRGKRSKRR